MSGDEVTDREKAAPAAPSRLLSVALSSLAVAGGLGAIGYIRGPYQRGKMFLPNQLPNGGSDPSGPLPSVDVRFATEDGVELHGWWLEHPRARATVVYCHGSAGHLLHHGGILETLYGLEVSLLAFDYRGYGESGGEPSEEGLYRDARAAWDHVTGELGRAPQSTLLFGHSLGGAVAVDAALYRPAAGLVVQASFTGVREMARLRHPQLSWVARQQFSSIEKVAHLDLPKLFLHGTADETIPLEHSHELFTRASSPRQLYLVPQAGHNDVHVQGGIHYRRQLSSFIDRCLSPV